MKLRRFFSKISEFKAIEVSEFSPNTLSCKKLIYNLDKNLSPNQLIIKVHATPINPFNILQISGVMPGYKPPFIPGIECSGTIHYSTNKSLIGKKISAFCGSSWAEYTLVDESKAIFLKEETDMDQAACGTVNPITACGLIETAIAKGAKTVINSAANSALGKMIYNVARAKGIDCINIVRSEKNVRKLNNFVDRNSVVLDFQEEGFIEKLKKVCEERNPTVFLDCVGGSLSAKILNEMPMNSTLVCYGNMGGVIMDGINLVQIRMLRKKIEGFTLFSYYDTMNREEKEKINKFVAENLSNFFTTEIKKVFKFEEVNQALSEIKGEGKILLKP